MGSKDKRIDAYIAKAGDFAKPILDQLRKAIHAGCPSAEESLKWRHPAFMYKGMLCGMAAFKEHCTFGFWKHSLMFSNNSTAQKKAEAELNRLGRITRVNELPPENRLREYIKEAMRLNDEGVKIQRAPKPRGDRTIIVPEFFAAALKKNRQALTAFENFSYTNKKEYVEWLTEAKREETRASRLETAIAWIAEGKPRNWKYMNC